MPDEDLRMHAEPLLLEGGRPALLEMRIETVEDLKAVVAMLPDLFALIRGEDFAALATKLRESNDRVEQALAAHNIPTP